jgi:hypothetical protein
VKIVSSRHIALFLVALVLLTAGWVISAQPARDKIIDSALLGVVDGHVVLQVKLTFPFRYQSHFPQETGEELRIRLTPVRIPPSDLNAVFRRESIVPPSADTVAIDEVVYEGDAAGGPYLTVRFTQRVRYQVIQGGDYRSLNIVIQELL